MKGLGLDRIAIEGGARLEGEIAISGEVVFAGYGITAPEFGYDDYAGVDVRGKVVLVHFYAFQCHNCQANFRTYNRWQKTLRDQGVELVGIQTPETEAERDAARVTEAAHQCEFGFPVMLDLDNQAWKAWGNSVWPTIYIVDQRGYVRTWWVGELYWQGARGDQSVEGWVRRLLAEAKPTPP